MHILIIPSEHFLTSRSPLGGIFQMHQAKALHNAGHKVGVISVGVISPRFIFSKYPYPKNENINGINILRKFVRIFIPYRWHSFENLKKIHIQLGLEVYANYVKEYGVPDIIHAHNFLYAGFISEAIKSKFNIPYIITEHSSIYARGFISKDLDKSIEKCAKSAKAITAVSNAFAKLLQSKIKNLSIAILPNIVDDSFLKIKEAIKDKNSFVFLNIASLDDNKNHKLLINSFANIANKKNIILKIGGDGSLSQELKDLAKHLKIDDRVSFLGLLSQNEVVHEMSSADCFVLSSTYETFGVVLIEALACGLPLIATKSGGPEDIINSENGILVNINAQKEMEEAMIYMYENINRYDKDLLKEYALHTYGERAFVKNVMQFYGAKK